MDQIRFKKRAGIVRQRSKFDFWYLYINDVKIKKYFIEKESTVPYYLIIREDFSIAKGRRTTSVGVGWQLLFRDLYSAKKGLLDIMYGAVQVVVEEG